MRPIWSGTISFGLVTIPARLFSSVESRSEVSFRLLDRDTLTPIKEVRMNPETGEEIPWERVVRGVEHGKDQFVPLTPEELKALPLPSARTIDIFGFVDADQIDSIFHDRAYYLGPGEGGDKAYELLRRALEEQGKVGIGKVALRTREHLAAVAPKNRVLVLQTLYFADEVRAAGEVPGVPEGVRIAAAERKMADELVRSMAIAFEPAEYKSEYKQALRKLVKAKLEGKELAAPKAPAKVIDLQEALRRSLAQARRGERERPARRQQRRAAG